MSQPPFSIDKQKELLEMQVPHQDDKKFQSFLTFCWWEEGLYALLPVGQKFFANHSIILETIALVI